MPSVLYYSSLAQEWHSCKITTLVVSKGFLKTSREHYLTEVVLECCCCLHMYISFHLAQLFILVEIFCHTAFPRTYSKY